MNDSKPSRNPPKNPSPLCEETEAQAGQSRTISKHDVGAATSRRDIMHQLWFLTHGRLFPRVGTRDQVSVLVESLYWCNTSARARSGRFVPRGTLLHQSCPLREPALTIAKDTIYRTSRLPDPWFYCDDTSGLPPHRALGYRKLRRPRSRV